MVRKDRLYYCNANITSFTWLGSHISTRLAAGHSYVVASSMRLRALQPITACRQDLGDGKTPDPTGIIVVISNGHRI